MPLRVFWSYSHKDRKSLGRVREAFAVMERNGEIESWHDGVIDPGTEWSTEISKAMDTADIVLLLVTTHFLASQFCIANELRQAKARTPAVPIVPIILGTCDWKSDSVLGAMEALPEDGKAIRRRWTWDEDSLLDVVKGVRRVVAKAGSALPPREPPRQPVPETLPYLCDRDIQDFQLEESVRAHFRQAPHRPYVCLIHGDETEQPIGYLERLRAYSLPRYLEIADEAEFQECYWLRWPDANLAAADAEEQFRYSLAAALDCPADRVVERLNSLGRPVLVYSELSSDEWSAAGEAFISAFLRFWDAFPAVAGATRLVACTVLQYSLSSPPTGVKDSIRSALAVIDGQLREGRYPNLSGLLLPELKPVAVTDVRGLAGKARMQQYCRLERHRVEWISAVNAIFGERKTLPMRELEKHLRELFPRFAEKG